MIAIVIQMLSMLLFVRVLSFKIVYMFLQCQCGQIVDSFDVRRDVQFVSEIFISNLLDEKICCSKPENPLTDGSAVNFN